MILKAKTDKQRETEREQQQKDTDKCLLRDRITTIYYGHRDKRELYQYEFENCEHLYDQYKKLGGNSFVDKIWNEMKKWTINP